MVSLECQTCPLNEYEVIIIDNGSTDGTASFLEGYKPTFNFKYIYMENKGRAAARNKGLEYAQNELIIFTDDDLILSPNFICEHLKMQKTNNGVVHGKIINLSFLKFFEDPTNGTLYSYLKGGKAIKEGMKSKCISEDDIIKRFEEVIMPNNKVTAVEKMIQKVLSENFHEMSWIGFTGGNVSISKKILEHTGGFDESFGLNWGCEDLELGYRICQKGCIFSYCENAINYHIAHYRPNFDVEHSKTANYFYAKHPDPNILHFQDFISGKINSDQFAELFKSKYNYV